MKLNERGDVFVPVLGVIFFGIIFLIGMAVVAERKEGAHRKQLFEQCMADGHKEYECVHLLNRRNNSTVLFLPM